MIFYESNQGTQDTNNNPSVLGFSSPSFIFKAKEIPPGVLKHKT